jgi:hypothetical protein
MAENRGGMRPTAPQNNPANISATGGNGQSGTQPARYISGMAYGEGQATMQQQQSAPMAGSSAPRTSAPSAPSLAALSQGPAITSLNAPTERPDEPITQGSPMGAGAGPEILNLPTTMPNELDDAVSALQILFLQNPRNQDVRRALETMEREGRLG